MWEGDSEALLQAVRFLGYGRAIAFGDEGGRSLLGMREGDRFLGMREGDSEALLQAVRFLGCGSAITFGMWEGDSEALLQAVRFWGCGGDRFRGMWGDRFLVWSAIVF
jgi:hypothetical protein